MISPPDKTGGVFSVVERASRPSNPASRRILGAVKNCDNWRS
jgi:hypothetical protein